MNVKTMLDEELIETHKECFDSIYNIECYGISDMHILRLTEGELIRRGYKMEEYTNVNWVKVDK